MYELGNWLQEAGLISDTDLSRARELQQKNGMPLSMALIDLELVPEEELVEVMAKHHQLPKAPRKLHRLTVPPRALTVVPQDHCWQYGLFPFDLDQNQKILHVAILEPRDQEAMALLRRLPLRLELYIAGPKQLEKALRKHYMDSIMEDTSAGALRFFGYEKAESPDRPQQMEAVVLAKPGALSASAALPPEPALQATSEIPLPPVRGVPIADLRLAAPEKQPAASAPSPPADLETLQARVEHLEAVVLELLRSMGNNANEVSLAATRASAQIKQLRKT